MSQVRSRFPELRIAGEEKKTGHFFNVKDNRESQRGGDKIYFSENSIFYFGCKRGGGTGGYVSPSEL
jgi:hypothetical protein